MITIITIHIVHVDSFGTGHGVGTGHIGGGGHTTGTGQFVLVVDIHLPSALTAHVFSFVSHSSLVE